MKIARMIISYFRFILFNLKIFGEIVTTFFLCENTLSKEMLSYQRVMNYLLFAQRNHASAIQKPKKVEHFCKRFLQKNRDRVTRAKLTG